MSPLAVARVRAQGRGDCFVVPSKTDARYIRVMPNRDRKSLLSLFDEQLQFLDASADAYDRGLEAEAKRLAVTIRILVHDTTQSHSLLTQLGVKDRLRWLDTATPIVPANLLPTNGLAIVKMTAGGSQGASAQYVPPLEKFPIGRANRPADFERWWETPVTKDGNGNLFTRRDFVMTVSNKEGGAHVDPKLNSAYRQITEDNSLGIVSFETSPETEERLERAAEGNAALASVRQIAWEIVSTLRQQALFLLYPLGDPRRPTSTLTLDTQCPCDSGRVAKRCHLANGKLAIDLGNSLLDKHPLDAAAAYQIGAAAGQPKGSFNLGLALHSAGDLEGAELAFSEAMANGDAAGASNLGLMRQDMADEDGARKAWEEGTRLGGELAMKNLAYLHEARGRDGDAESLYQRLLDLGSLDAGLKLGRLLRNKDDLPKARAVYEQLEAAGDDRAAFNIARMDYDCGNLPEARQRLTALVKSPIAEIAQQARALLGSLDAA